MAQFNRIFRYRADSLRLANRFPCRNQRGQLKEKSAGYEWQFGVHGCFNGNRSKDFRHLIGRPDEEVEELVAFG